MPRRVLALALGVAPNPAGSPRTTSALDPWMLALEAVSTVTAPATALEAGAPSAWASAIALQDNLLVASNDLDRLQRLLHDASRSLMEQFTLASQQLDDGAPALARRAIGDALTALQFEDLATQLIAHTASRLRHCADRIARDALTDEGDEAAHVQTAPERPNPVTCDEMDAGSIELF